MDPDINNSYQAENDPQYGMEINGDKIEIENTEANEKQKKTSGPKNDLEWKVHDLGLNQIQSPAPLLLYSLKKRSIVLAPMLCIMDASAFARYVKWDAWHQNQLNQLAYIEEGIEKDRAQKEEVLKEKPKIKEEQSKDSTLEQMTIKRMDAA